MPKAATRLRSFEIHKTQLTLQEKALHFFFWISHCMLAVGDLDWWPHLANFRLDVLIVVFSGTVSFSRIWSHGERERERGGGGWSKIEQNLPLAWTSLSVACPTICMQRRDKRDSNVSWSASQRRVTKRTVAYRPAVSIRFTCLESKIGFPTCLFLASPLSGPYERRPMGSRKEQLSPLFFVAWTTQPLHQKLVMGFRRAKLTQWHKPSERYFCWRSTSGSLPVGLNPFTATGCFHRQSPRWPTFLAMLFQILKEGMGLPLSDELEVQYHVVMFAFLVHICKCFLILPLPT